jgi:polyisoprenoid-binding protein YceI
MAQAPTSTATRTVDGVELPAAGTWEIDGSHSSASFSVKHLMVSKVRGRFGTLSGTIHVADDATASSVEVTIDAASIDTNDDKRDEHLRSADFLDVEGFPTLTFRSTGVRHVKGSRWEVDGELTIRGVTRPVTLDLELAGVEQDPWGGRRVGFEATTEINREDWGLSWNAALESGGVVVGKKVRIDLDVEATFGS